MTPAVDMTMLLDCGPYLTLREAEERYEFGPGVLRTAISQGRLLARWVPVEDIPPELWLRLESIKASVKRRGGIQVTTDAAIEWLLAKRRRVYRTNRRIRNPWYGYSTEIPEDPEAVSAEPQDDADNNDSD